MKEKLTIPQQIAHMKSKGINFNIISELEAQKILSQSTYYFKPKVYTKNYNKNEYDKYNDIDFSYLYEMSKLDLAFRNFVLKLTLNIEHLTKTKFLTDFAASDEDGYEIVDKFLIECKTANDHIEKLKTTNNGKGGSYDIVKHYIDDKLPIWVIAEVLQFNDFLSLYKIFYSRNKYFLNNKTLDSYLMSLNSVKWLRNLSAHNNCLLIKLNKFDNQERDHLVRKIIPFRMNIEPKDKAFTIEKMVRNSIVEAFLETWIFFLKICNSTAMKNHAREELGNFFEYSKDPKKIKCRKSSPDIDNFFNFIEKSCKIL